MKKYIFILLLVGLGYFIFMRTPIETDMQISLADASVVHGDLVLVNREVALQADPVNLVEIPADLSSNVQIHDRYLIQQQMLTPLQQLFETAHNDGVDFFILNSAYRSGKLQQQLFDEHGASLALPSGHSEHQTGLSIDIGSVHGTMDHANEGRWLETNAAQYGFILRYPADKVDVTGIDYEPWHFRYVGLPHSVIMEENNMVLEEYLAFLKKKKIYQTKIDGVSYVIQYSKSADTTRIPETTHYTISGDNMNGFIITSIVD